MPELDEVRLTSDFVNEKSKGLVFNKIWKNPEHKWKDIVSPLVNSILCYGNKCMSRLEDPNGRVFWYDSK